MMRNAEVKTPLPNTSSRVNSNSNTNNSNININSNKTSHDLLYPNERRAGRQLTLAFPEADAELIEEIAYLVSARRHTIQDAIDILMKMEEANNASNNNNKNNNKNNNNNNNTGSLSINEVRKSSVPQPTSSILVKNNSNTEEVARRRISERVPTQSQTSTSRTPSYSHNNNNNNKNKNNIIRNHISNGNKPILFTTTMTGDRRVRDHCRQIETLLYLKRIQYETVNVADDPLLQRRLRELYTAFNNNNKNNNNIVGARALVPPMPAFFMGEHFIGDYEKLQEMEDDGVLMETLQQLGYVEDEEKKDKEL